MDGPRYEHDRLSGRDDLTFPQLIQQRLQELDLNVSQLAALTDKEPPHRRITRSAWQHWMDGGWTHGPKEPKIPVMMAALQVSREQILESVERYFGRRTRIVAFPTTVRPTVTAMITTFSERLLEAGERSEQEQDDLLAVLGSALEEFESRHVAADRDANGG